MASKALYWTHMKGVTTFYSWSKSLCVNHKLTLLLNYVQVQQVCASLFFYQTYYVEAEAKAMTSNLIQGCQNFSQNKAIFPMQE